MVWSASIPFCLEDAASGSAWLAVYSAAPSWSTTNANRLPNLTDEVEKRLLNVDASEGRCFVEGDLPLLGKILGFGRRHLSLIFQVTFVAAEYNGHAIGVLHSKDLLTELVDFVVGLSRSDRVCKDKALASAHVLKKYSESKATGIQQPQEYNNEVLSMAQRENHGPDLAWPSTPPDQPYQGYQASMFHHQS